VSKSAALIVGLSIITLFGLLAFFLPTRAASLGTILTAVVSLVTAYIGLQVVNYGVKGHFYNPEVYNAENPREGKNDGEK